MSHKKKLIPLALAVIVAGASVVSLVRGQNVPSVKPYVTEKLTELKPLRNVTADVKSTSDLKAVEDRVEVITRNALPAIVNIQITMLVPDGTMAGEQGSGVIVSKDGYVLTAGHVSGEPGKDCVLVLSNGTRVLGKTMGANSLYDSGMIKIESRPNEEFPFMPMGSIAKMKAGDWVIAMGHPGGLQRGRAPVVRLGKILQIVDRRSVRNGEWFFQTDCPLIMGDSGGPVFDMDGKVVGINSKIGLQTTSNIHVPIDTFEDTWDRLAKGDKWGPSTNIFASRSQGPVTPAPDATPPQATLNAKVDNDPKGIVVKSVREDKAADKAHIYAGDIITRVDGTIVKTYDDLKKLLLAHKPGDKVTLDLLGSTTSPNSRTRQVQVVLDAADR
jgi:serine protease Do